MAAAGVCFERMEIGGNDNEREKNVYGFVSQLWWEIHVLRENIF